ncbi:hypothetical protein TorRG33x02_164260 [Trema orientale]|uniref:Retrovirus-related Pol polyprotein from transposon TNT 1-94 n=1 Tax=Trema orientale TaxID=63057 RepID=A0A2P5EQ98_TREOI|nr:hypothetical protein TorRG33x02_164260 [Trema orientale]
MTASSSTKFDMPRFNDSNHLAWKLKMHAILIKDGYAVALKGKENNPKEIKDQVFDDELAMPNIYLALDEVVLFNVSEETKAKCLWKKLQNLYEEKSMSNKIFLRKKLYNLKMAKDSSFQEHLSKFNTLISRLVAISVDEKERASLMLCSKPESLGYLDW